MRIQPVLLIAGLLIAAPVAIYAADQKSKVNVRLINTVQGTVLTAKAAQIDPIKGLKKAKVVGKEIPFYAISKFKKALTATDSQVTPSAAQFQLYSGETLVHTVERPLNFGAFIDVIAVKSDTDAGDIVLFQSDRFSIPEGSGQVGFVQAVRDAPTLEMTVVPTVGIVTYNDNGLQFKSTSYANLPVGEHTITVKIQGTNTVLNTSTFNILPGQSSLVVMYGTWDPSDAHPITARVLLDTTKF